MGYLNYLPKFKYTLAKFTGNVSDIFRRVAFTQKSRSDPRNYSEYLTEGVETTDGLASSKLGDANYYWQILMMNNIISEDEFPATYDEYSKKVNTLKNGTSLFFYEFFGSTPKAGDIVFPASTCCNILDFQSGGVISNYDSILRKIDMEYTFGDGFGDAGTTAAVYGYNDFNQLYQKGIQEFVLKSTIDNSVSYFYDDNNRETSPYLIPTGMTGGSFSNPLGTTPGEGSLLQVYMIGDALPIGYFYRSELQYYTDEQFSKRNIKIPPVELADSIDQKTERFLRDGNVPQGTSTSVVGYDIVKVGASTTTLVSESSSGSGGGGSNY